MLGRRGILWALKKGNQEGLKITHEEGHYFLLMATDTEAISLGNMRLLGGDRDLSEPRLEGWQRAWGTVTWRWEKELQCQTEMVWVFGNREKVNETRTGWTTSKGSTPRMRLETLTGPWAWQMAVEKQWGVKLLTQEQMKASGGLNVRM